MAGMDSISHHAYYPSRATPYCTYTQFERGRTGAPSSTVPANPRSIHAARLRISVAAEAGSLGIPVIATRVDGLRDVIADNQTGYLVEPDDEAAMAERIIQLINDPALRNRMGEAGRRRVAEHFDIRKNIKDLEAIYALIHQQ